jgi:hypothetical protein
MLVHRWLLHLQPQNPLLPAFRRHSSSSKAAAAMPKVATVAVAEGLKAVGVTLALLGTSSLTPTPIH